MKIAIIQFPGSNCEQESQWAIQRAGMDPVPFLWNQAHSLLERCDGYFIVGGFSYEDRSRAGVIAAYDPIMKILRQQSEKGKPILGICNGAQILLESGLVPGFDGYPLSAALARNVRVKDDHVLGTGFYNAWIHVRAENDGPCLFTKKCLPGATLKMPVAHAEGRFVMEPDVLERITAAQLIAFTYCNEHGTVSADFPVNPNGSMANIAALCNPRGNIMAMMPHPERSERGQIIFSSLREYLQGNSLNVATQVSYIPKQYNIAPYQRVEQTIEFVTELLITDNEAVSVESAIRQKINAVSVKKYRHWEITVQAQDVASVKQRILESCALFNPNKERLVSEIQTGGVALLVQDREDCLGASLCTLLQQRYNLPVTSVRSGIVWSLYSEYATIIELQNWMSHHFVLYNPFSQDAFFYTNTTEDATVLGDTLSATLPLIQHTHMSYHDVISGYLDACLVETKLPLPNKRQGKVRDIYEKDDALIIITTDRQSAFDRVLAAIPFKGHVLNKISLWWFNKTAHIIPNHVISSTHPNITIAKKCTPLPIEVIVRGYLTGSTKTSVWTQYEKGVRFYCGNILPEGMKKNQAFPEPIITPTTKGESDELISGEEIVQSNLLTEADWQYVKEKALALFAYGQQVAHANGLVLVDTKYEFGRDREGRIVLIDEVHTPDSSRYWLATTYERRIAEGREPDNIDKEFLRLWFTEHCDPYHDVELPVAPKELVVELSNRYIRLYEMITGEKFVFPSRSLDYHQSIMSSLEVAPVSSVRSKEEAPVHVAQILTEKQPVSSEGKVVLIMGSKSDRPYAQKIVDVLKGNGVRIDLYVASAHKEPRKVLDILDREKGNVRVVYITCAGRSNALSGFVAANTTAPTIACPPFSDKMDMLVNIHSTLQMPSHVPVMTVLDPENAALAAMRILSNHKSI